MLPLYEKIERLCETRGINVTEMCRSANVPRSALSDYKTGRKKTINLKNLEKIADFFTITLDELTGREPKKGAPTQEGERRISDDDVKLALFGGAGDVTDEMWNEALFAVELIKKRHEKGK